MVAMVTTRLSSGYHCMMLALRDLISHGTPGDHFFGHLSSLDSRDKNLFSKYGLPAPFFVTPSRKHGQMPGTLDLNLQKIAFVVK
jgi:hypothetical protein